MMSRRIFSALSLVLIIACSDDDSAPLQPPAPLTADEQIVANCQAIQNGLEKYAATHNGTYGEYEIAWNEIGVALVQLENPYSGEQEPSGLHAGAPGQIGIEDYACGGTVYGYRITGYGRDHMLTTLESLDNVPADVRYTHDVTVANAYLVMDAAKRFAETNDGVYSTDIAGDTNNNGQTLQDMLPNNDHGGLLNNPFTGSATEPQDGLALATPGAIGHLGADSGSGDIDSFTMEAYDCDGAIMLTLVPYTQYGEVVWRGAYILRTSIEKFAKAAGHYPHNLDTETTPGGKTVLDLISETNGDNVPYFINWYNQDHYVPTVGTPTGKFAIAYQPIETAGTVTDYVITGRVVDEIVRLGPKPLP
jgi:hypothetical protein